MKKYQTIGIIGRFKPLHLGNAAMLEMICSQAHHVKIGIGSSNRYDARNPFTAEETRRMIDAFLSPRYHNYTFLFLEDVADDQEWTENLVRAFGSLDAMVSGNPFVRTLLQGRYALLDPFEIVPPEKRAALKSSMVRAEMARQGNWQQYLPREVVDYLHLHCVVERFQKNFGEELLKTLEKEVTIYQPEEVEEERQRIHRR